jgi:hypothetical protein
MGRRMSGAALLAMLLVPAAGCGGESERQSPEPSGPPTKAEFLERADEICLSYESQIEAAGDELFARRRRPSPAEARDFASEVAIPKLREEIEAIRALGVPEGDEQPIEAILAAAARGIEQIRRNPEVLIGAAPPALRKAGRLARRYGSRECGSG